MFPKNLNNKKYLSYDKEEIKVNKSSITVVPTFDFLKVYNFMLSTDYFTTYFNLVKFYGTNKWYFNDTDNPQVLIEIDFKNFSSLKFSILNIYNQFDEMKRYKSFFIYSLLQELFKKEIEENEK